MFLVWTRCNLPRAKDASREQLDKTETRASPCLCPTSTESEPEPMRHGIPTGTDVAHIRFRIGYQWYGCLRAVVDATTADSARWHSHRAWRRPLWMAEKNLDCARQLFRDCLRLADYLSARQGSREALRQQVRVAFRKNLDEKDPEKIEEHKEACVAMRGRSCGVGRSEVCVLSSGKARAWVLRFARGGVD